MMNGSNGQSGNVLRISFRVIRALLLILLLVPLLTALFVLVSGPDYEIPLPHGYKIVRFHSGSNGFVAPSGSVVISPTVIYYAIRGDYVVGYTKNEGGTGNNGMPVGPARYFIVDTGNDGIEQGLDRNAWAEALGKRNLDTGIELRRVQRPIPLWFSPIAWLWYHVVFPIVRR